MKRLIFIEGIIFIIISIFFSCNTKISDAQYLGSKFYNLLMQGKYDDLYFLLDDKIIKTLPLQNWRKDMTALINQRGQLQDFRPLSIDIYEDKDENMFVKIKFKVSYTYGIFRESLTMIYRKADNQFKIINYNYSD